MGKYSFEFKSTIVQEYLEGEGGLGYLAKIQGVRSKKGTRMDQSKVRPKNLTFWGRYLYGKISFLIKTKNR